MIMTGDVYLESLSIDFIHSYETGTGYEAHQTSLLDDILIALIPLTNKN